MSEPIVYSGGQFIPHSQARIGLHDAGLVFGATVSDLCRTFHHRLFRLEDHLRRFRQSCEAMSVPQALSDVDLTRIAEQLVEHNAPLLAPEQELLLAMFATPGEIGANAPTLVLHTYPLPFERYHHFFKEGVRLVTPPTRAIPTECLSPLAKHRGRLHWWNAEYQARQIHPHGTALLLTTELQVTETAIANVLLVRQGHVVSPSRDKILNGISLQVVEELCAALRIPFMEGDFTLPDCYAAEEMMLTGTAFCLAPVSSLNYSPVPSPGPVFERLLTAWNEKVGLDVREQVRRLGVPSA